MDIDEREKVTIVLGLLNERYNASHKMRERSLQFAIWILGIGIAFVWILLSEVSLTISLRTILTLLVIVIGGGVLWFLYALEKGFEKNREVMINIEETLGCYTEGKYIDSKPLFPKEYKETRKKSPFGHFRSIYILIISVTILIIFLIWFVPTYQHKKNLQAPVEGQKTTKAHIINTLLSHYP